MANYAATAASARAKIEQAGKGAVALFKRPNDDYDPTTDTDGDGAEQETSAPAMQTRGDVNRLAALGLELIDPVTLLVAGAGLAFVPEPGHEMTWAGVAYTVKDVDTLAPDGETMITHKVTGSK